MANFKIKRPRADIIQNADSIVNNYPREKEKDHIKIATDALRARHYSTAAMHYIAALEVGSDDPDLHYGLALALLGGVRPHRHTRESIDDGRQRRS